MFTELDPDIDEQIEYFERLTKAADATTREYALSELDRIATVDLEKVGPKGYIHGWIFVGAPGVGDRVFHPHHGHGVVRRSGKRTVGVRFDSGKEHAFEHTGRGARHGEAIGHFGHRLDGRTGKPVRGAEVGPTEHGPARFEVRSKQGPNGKFHEVYHVDEHGKETLHSQHASEDKANVEAARRTRMASPDGPKPEQVRPGRTSVRDLRNGDYAHLTGTDQYGKTTHLEGFVGNSTPVRVGKPGSRKKEDMLAVQVTETRDGANGWRGTVYMKPSQLTDEPRYGVKDPLRDTGWVPIAPKEKPTVEAKKPEAPKPTTPQEHLHAAEERDLAANAARAKLNELERQPTDIAAASRRTREARALNEQIGTHRRAAAEHRAAADKLRAQGATPEERALSHNELNRMADQAEKEGRHEDAARAYEERAKRLRSGDSGWTLTHNAGTWAVTGGKDSGGAYQSFPSRKQAEEWRREADKTTADIQDHKAAEQRRLAAVKPRESIETGTGHAKPGLPRAAQAKRGDIVLVSRPGSGGLTSHHVGRVTNVTRDGKVTAFQPAHRDASRPPVQLNANDKTHVIPKDRIDGEAALAHVRADSQPAGYFSRQEAAASLHPHVRPEGHAEATEKPTPDVSTPKAPKAPSAPKERKPGEARRGDLVLVHEKRTEGTRDGRGRTAHRLTVAQVTSVTRDGKVKEYLNGDAGPGARPYKVSNDHLSTQYHVLPQEKFDTEAALAAYRDRKWTPGGLTSKPYESLDEAREAMKPHLREETPKVPEKPEVKAPEVYKPKPGGDLDLHTENSARDHLAAGRTPETMEAFAARLSTQAAEHRAAGRMREASDAEGKAERFRMTAQRMREISEGGSKPKPPEPERPTRAAREEVEDARKGADYIVTQHPAVKRAEQAVYRSAHSGGLASPAAVRELHEAYRTAGAEAADKDVSNAWERLDRSERAAAITDPKFGDAVLAHLAEVHRSTRSRNDPSVSAETRKAHAEAADKAYRNVHSVRAITERREREDARRAAARDRINSGDMSAAADLLPPKPSDAHVRRIAEATTPQVDSSLTGKRLQAAKAVRDAQVEVERTKMHEDAARSRVEAQRSISPTWNSGSVKEALNAETRRNADEWGEATKAREAAQARLDAAKGALSAANAEHHVKVGQQHAEVMRQMREQADALPALPKSTEGKDIAKEAGVPRTITRLTGHEKELAREVNKRADILSEGRDKSNTFNRQADIVEATHARLTGTLHPEVQDRLNALYDQARDQRGGGPTGVYRENLDEAIKRWNEFQRAKNGVAPRDEQEMYEREITALQVQSKEPELAARIRAGNKPGGAVESEEAESALPIPDLPKPKSGREPKPYVEPAENTLEPGAKVSWTHQHEDGTTTQRTGRVWSKAPKPSNAQDAAWVTPDEKLPSDRYSAIVVHQDRPTKKGRPVHFVSHDSDRSHSGSLAQAAADVAARNRTTGKSFRPLVEPIIEAAIEHALSVVAA